MESSSFPRATALAHQLIRERLSIGDTALDATVGNGHDTLFLANHVGDAGRVFGFDIQTDAIESTRQKIREAGRENVTLFQASHADIAKKITAPITAAMFNLGYLPGGDKAVITQPDSTLTAIQACLTLDAKILTLVIYPGHEGGREEADAVIHFISEVDQEKFSAIQYGFINQRNAPPFLIAITPKK